MAPPESATGAPTRVGRYEVIAHLATGGMAQIYLARQSGLGSFERHVVLKTILRERASDQRFVTMFLDEAKLAATLNHHNIAQVYEVDQADGAYFMAMEYVHGENARAILETAVRRGWTIPLELAIMIVGGAAAGLHHAHERHGKTGQPLNIVHRDVSPANIMIGYDGSVKVLDFGIAKAEERATKTVGGTIKGKYGYMSPEQCKGKPIDRRSDIFALGIVLYELTTLRRAFKGNDDFETMKRIVAGDVVLPSVAVAGYPRELEAIILTAMANDPSARFQTSQELLEALDAFAVRSKLTGSNTAMGRFMVQLFGAKKEPWVEGASLSHERTEVSEGDVDNEKTNVVEPRHQAALTSMITARIPTVGDLRQAGIADAAAWQHAAEPRPRPTPSSYDHSDTAREAREAREAQEAQAAQEEEGASTLPGTAPPPVRVTPAGLLPQALLPGDELSDAGAQPLVNDLKLGWETSPSDRKLDPGNGGATSLASEAADFKIRSSSRWLIFTVVLVILAAFAVMALGLEWFEL
ncbi:MAG: serine/threonine protein kinase [Deltaproteobacteria bacterium]|nr:serine/threonine protein kinase [Deltaproteobacteria bacterium]